MTRFHWAILVVLLADASAARGEVHYKNEEHCFTLDLVDGWARISDADLETTVRTIGQPPGGARYVAAFQYGGAEPFSYPYIIVQVILWRGAAKPTAADIRRMLGSVTPRSVEDSTRSLTTQARALVRPTPQAPRVDIDERSLRYTLTIDAEVAEVGRVVSHSYGFVAESAIVQLICCSPAHDFEKQRQLFGKVADSFRWLDMQLLLRDFKLPPPTIRVPETSLTDSPWFRAAGLLIIYAIYRALKGKGHEKRDTPSAVESPEQPNAEKTQK